MRVIVRLAVSVAGGGVFYALWLAAALSGRGAHEVGIGAPWTILAPVITSLGFAVGLVIAGLLTGRRGGFGGAWLWALAGCAVGAIVAYQFGPMLIVFGMFAVGTAAVAAREITLRRREAASG